MPCARCVLLHVLLGLLVVAVASPSPSVVPSSGVASIARSIASMATNVTADFVQSYCTCSTGTSNSALQSRLYPSFLQGATKSLQAAAPAEPSAPQVPIRVQLDVIAAAPLITTSLHSINAASAGPLLIAIPTPPFAAPSQIAFSRPTLPTDGRWSDFPGGTLDDLGLFLDPRNVRVQHYMLYRHDVLRAANVTSPPQTWEQVLAAAAAVNGTDMDGDGAPDAALCVDAQPTCGLPYLILKILLPMMIHSYSTTQAFIFDPATMRPLANTAAMRTALSTYAQLAPYNSATRGACLSLHPAFTAGRCAITFTFQQELPTAPRLRGRLGTALPPGSTRIWDAPSDSLLPCTAARCPYAAPPRPPLPAHPPDTLINFVPFNFPLLYTFVPYPQTLIDPSPALATFTAHYTHTLNSFLIPFTTALAPLLPANRTLPSPPPFVASPSPSPSRSTARAAVPTPAQLAASLAALAAQRAEISPSARASWAWLDPRPYLQQGLHLDDALEFLYTASQILAFNNNYHGLPVPGASYYRVAIGEAARHAARPQANLSAICQTLDAKYRMVLQAFNNDNQYRELYWSGIGYRQPSPSPPAPPAAAAAAAGQASKSTRFWNQSSFAGVLVACTLLLLLAVAALYMWRRAAQRPVSFLGKRLAPGLGPATTLLVTDIQGSTALWERLPADLMEAALEVHHATLQQLLGRFQGYESATEGDSFILAFHCPHDALAYAAAAQLALVHADWPQQLLEVAELAPVGATPRPTTSAGCHSAIVQALQAAPSRATAHASTPLRRSPHTAATSPRTGPFHRLASRLQPLVSCLAPNKLRPCLPLSKLRAGLHCLPGCLPTNQQQQQEQEAPESCPLGQLGMEMRGMDSTAAELELMPPDEEETLGSYSFSWALHEAWTHRPLPPSSAPSYSPAAGPSANPRPRKYNPIWRGLRVRMGLHSGLTDAQLLSTNQTTGRTQYSGSFLAAAQQVCDAGHGGQVLLSHSAFHRLSTQPRRRASSPAHLPLILAMGEHSLREGQAPVSLYQAVVPGLEARLGSLGPVRSLAVEAEGVLAAPIGTATVVFMRVSDVAQLLAWDAGITKKALTLLHDMARLRMARYGGYIAELVDGLVLAVFPRAVDAIKWSLEVQQALLVADWPQPLLQHALCEPVVASMAVSMPETGMTMEVQKLALRGLRLKVGIGNGEVLDYISPTTGRIMYRGRVMNRAARVAALATAGQVLCTETTWRMARQAPPAELRSFSVVPAGQHILRGVTGAVGLRCCSHVSHVPTSSAIHEDDLVGINVNSNAIF